MNKQFKIYGSYLAILATILIAIMYLGVPTKYGLWGALAVAAVYGIFWPRWGR
ncbi:MAG: hypothetical protein ACYC21_08210 [Eubacteriales bacterium]